MATAPTPGVGRRQEETADDQIVLTITVKRPIKTRKGRLVPETHTIVPALIPIREQTICRKATGLPPTAFFDEHAIAMDSLFIMWWMARRLSGDAWLTYSQAEKEWPLDLDAEEELEVEISGVDDDESDEVDEDPEG